MTNRYPQFDRSRLCLLPLEGRRHDLFLSSTLPLRKASAVNQEFTRVAYEIIEANKHKSSVVLMMGAHVLRSGVQLFLIDMMERGYLNCLAVNGAFAIHDYEFALIGATTESVALYIKEGYFGLWQETGQINEIVTWAWQQKMGLGEAVGHAIEEKKLPYREISVLANAHRLGIPVTVHVSIGCDITHDHPNFDGAAYGGTSYIDFLRLASVLESLEGGVVMNFGSAVMAPEVYLKALSMARNVARQKGQKISNITTLVCDLLELPPNYHEEPSKEDPAYYYRPWKTMLVRTVADGGKSFYFKGRHRETVPQLWTALLDAYERDVVK
jgi:hypothetical protein